MGHYYVKFDTMVSLENPGYGFINSKKVVAFKTRKEALDFFDDRQYYDFGSKMITRSEASFYAENAEYFNNFVLFRELKIGTSIGIEVIECKEINQ